MAANVWTFGIDYKGQPILDAWWTPGWTAQNRAKDSIQVPQNQFSAQGFPQNLNYVNVTGNYFDSSADPLSGYLTFWPSSALTITSGSQVTYIPQRYAGMNQAAPLGINNMGDGKIYLWYGQLSVSLLATDNANMIPVSFTYHVKEHYFEGLQYDIIVPSADVNTSVDIHSLIIPGSVFPADQQVNQDLADTVRIPSSSSQFLAVDITTMTGGMSFNPTSYPVSFAFIAGASQPQSSDWHAGSWSGPSSPYVAQILIGPNGLAVAPGSYQIWVQVAGPFPQEPVMPVGFLTIY